MEQQRTVQTAFRIRPDLLLRAKTRARTQGISLNSYVEKILEQDLASNDRYEEVRRQLKGTIKPNEERKPIFPLFDKVPEYTQEELDADPRLEYLVNKYLR